MKYAIPDLFALGDLETKSVFKACSHAHRALGELKGVVHTMPNPNILLGTLPLQEAKESSEIENIVTTQDDLYQSHYATQQFASGAAKEVHHYVQAMNLGFYEVKKSGLITLNLRYYVAVAQNLKCNRNRSKIFDALNFKTGLRAFLLANFS